MKIQSSALVCLFVACCWLGGNCTDASAADSSARAAGRALGNEGVEAYQAEDYVRATERLERAYAVFKAPSLALWSARALEKVGKWVEASERYLEATRLSADDGGVADVQKRAQRDAAAQREALSPRIPRLTILVEGASPEAISLLINDVSVSNAMIGQERLTNPGATRVVGIVGEQEVIETINLVEAAKLSVTLKFVDAPLLVASPSETEEVDMNPRKTSESTSPRKWQKPVAWVGIGLGGAGLIFATTTRVMANSKYKSMECDQDNNCTDEDAVNSVNAFRTMSAVGFVAGGILAAAGITLLFTAPKQENVAFISPYLGLDSAGFQGQF